MNLQQIRMEVSARFVKKKQFDRFSGEQNIFQNIKYHFYKTNLIKMYIKAQIYSRSQIFFSENWRKMKHWNSARYFWLLEYPKNSRGLCD